MQVSSNGHFVHCSQQERWLTPNTTSYISIGTRESGLVGTDIMFVL